jgi:hypothetical protein
MLGRRGMKDKPIRLPALIDRESNKPVACPSADEEIVDG